MLQDKDGFIWTCTNDGVVRYDGTHSVIYSNSNGFPDYGAFHMLQDKTNKLWFVTFSGKICYYQNKSFHTIPFQGKDSSSVKWIFTSPSGNLYFTTHTGKIFQVTTANEIRYVFSYPNCLFVAECLNDSLAIATDGSRYLEINLYSKQCHLIPVQSITNDFPRIGVTQDGLLLTCKNGIVLYNKRTTEVIIKAVEKIDPMAYYDDGTFLWVAHKNGLSKYLKKPNQPYELITLCNSNKLTSSVVRDHAGRIWFCGLYDGLHFIANEHVRIYHPESDKSRQNILLSVMCGKSGVSVFNQSGEVYQITNNGLSKVTEIRKGNKRQLVFFNTARINDHEFVISLEGEIVIYNTLTHRVYPIPLRINNSSAMYHYNNSEYAYILGKVQDGLYYLTTLGINGLKVIKEKEIKLKGIANFKSFAIDASGTAWFGNKDGLWYITDSIPQQLLFSNSAIQAYCSYIAVDKMNRLWVCTMGKGIYCIDPAKKRILLHLSSENGLNSDVCTKILIDHKQNIWASTSKGICKISKALDENKRQILHLSSDNILPGNTIFDIGLFQSKIFICTSKGLIECPAEIRISENTDQTPTYITRIDARNASLLTDRLVHTPSGNPVEINFVHIAFGKGEVARYQYRLNDARLKPWEYTTSTFVKYEQLLPGEYEFQVRIAPDRPGLNPQIASVSILVTPMYWQTWWFKLLMIGVFVLTFSLITIIYFTAKNKETISNKKLIESQLNSLRAQINPHFIFNSLNSIQDYILDQQPRMANMYLTKFASLMRMIVEHSKKEFTTLADETEFLELYLSLEKLRLNNELDITIQTDADIDRLNTNIPTMLLQPLIENAVKHGLGPSARKRILTIHFKLVDANLLRCIIEDNGVGRPPNQRSFSHQPIKSSVGILNIRERLELLFGNRHQFAIYDLYDEEGAACGTKVEIVIPVV